MGKLIQQVFHQIFLISPLGLELIKKGKPTRKVRPLYCFRGGPEASIFNPLKIGKIWWLGSFAFFNILDAFDEDRGN
jgi:hypothetical protein